MPTRRRAAGSRPSGAPSTAVAKARHQMLFPHLCSSFCRLLFVVTLVARHVKRDEEFEAAGGEG